MQPKSCRYVRCQPLALEAGLDPALRSAWTRVRLSRQLEGAINSNDAYHEAIGIKVQTRYLFSGSNSYTLSSNPYRASTSGGARNETTMGLG